jgi:hypothetical protein
MVIELEHYDLPEFWASALINGDYSGYEEDEIEAIESFTREMIDTWGKCWCVDVDESSFFTAYHDASHYVKACMAAKFTFDITGWESK